MIDASPQIDASIPTDVSACFGNLLNICLEGTPTQPLDIQDSLTIDTDSSPLCATSVNRADYCVMAATRITIGAPLRATGTRPLILIATESIRSRAAGSIDVGSHRVRSAGSPEIGAGADPAVCNVATTMPINAGGGAGGSFVGIGGVGGYNRGLQSSAPGQPAAPVNFITEVRGGCPGQDGHGSDGSNGAKGHGGGAVFLIAGTSITIEGPINAAGEGGGSGGVGYALGGGGGGGGGMIGLDAPAVTVTSLLIASGGGGGAGSSGGGGLGSGGPGSEPTTVASAPGGVAAGLGGSGGAGSSREVAGSGATGLDGFNSDIEAGGGGGGGGGAGIIKAPTATTFSLDTSPPAVP